jgi:hypothetical protein
MRLMISVVLSFCIGAGMIVTLAGAAEVPRMTKEELKDKLGDPNLILLDLRAGRDWKSSEFKIKGAVREDPADVKSWDNKYPKDKTIVLY